MEKESATDTLRQLYGLIGSPVGHSGSPAMYNITVFEKLGIDAAYLAFDCAAEKTAGRSQRAEDSSRRRI